LERAVVVEAQVIRAWVVEVVMVLLVAVVEEVAAAQLGAEAVMAAAEW
jgi:hypothetical protein